MRVWETEIIPNLGQNYSCVENGLKEMVKLNWTGSLSSYWRGWKLFERKLRIVNELKITGIFYYRKKEYSKSVNACVQ